MGELKKGRPKGVKAKPLLTRQRAESLAALLESIPAGVMLDPGNRGALDYLRDLVTWRLDPETQAKRDTINAAARLMPSKLKTHTGQGRGRKPKG